MPATVSAANGISFSQPLERVEAYDYVEVIGSGSTHYQVIARVDKPDASMLR
jgi:hypothetical protein